MNKPHKILLICLVWAGFMLSGCSDNSNRSDTQNPAQDISKKGKKIGAAGITSDGHDLLVWEEGELDAYLIKIDTIQITDSSFDGIAYFKGLQQGKIPEAGDIIASSITKNAPEGFLYKVAGVYMKGDTATVRVGYASIEDAVEEAEVSQAIELMFDEEGTLQNVRRKSIGATFNPSIPTFKYEDWGTISTNVSYTITLNVDITIKNFSLKYAKMSISQTKFLSQIIELQGKIQKEKKFDLASANLSTISFSIGPVPVVITPKLIAEGKISAKAELKVNSKFEIRDASEYGFKYEGGSFHIISDSDTQTDFDFKHSISGDVMFGILVGLELKFYGVLGFHVIAGPALKLSASTNGFFPRSSFDFKNVKEKVKLDLGTDMDLGVTVKIDLLFKTLKLLDKSWSPGFSFIKNLKESNLLPSFDKLNPSINETFNGIKFNSAIQKPDLGFAVDDYGFCLEEIGSNKCINGAGIRKVLGAIDGIEKYGIPSIDFKNLNPGTYNIYPYFQSGINIYYDKANIATIPDPKNIPDVKELINKMYGDASCIPDVSNFSRLYDARDDKWYMAVTIGTQTWMAENLNYNVGGSVCRDDDPANCDKYGRLYNWATAMDFGEEECGRYTYDYCGSKIGSPHQGICPSGGWHIPTIDEWRTLYSYAGGERFLMANKSWDPDSININGCSGFNALPSIENHAGAWWTATEYDYGVDALRVSMNSSMVKHSFTADMYKFAEYSIRCVKD